VVLYPSGKVSDIQEKQFTTLGQNITALEVDGTFDDCQRMVKQAFLDETLRKQYFLTSANSINIARLIPQSFYYFYAVSRAGKPDRPVVFSVPSGNFGNLTAGLLAKRMGLPVKKFIAATNVNDVVPEYLRTRAFNPRPSRQTISNAMDVGDPSNFSRMLDLFGHDHAALAASVQGCGFTDEETRAAMRHVFATTSYILDPHGAVGYLGLKRYQRDDGESTGIFLETAHPAKFKDTVEQTLGTVVAIPPGLRKFMAGEKKSVRLQNNLEALRDYLVRTL